MNEKLFRLDHDYDRSRADTGTRSRFGNYLNQRLTTFKEIVSDYGHDGGDMAVPFAAACWRIATGPVMAPPYVVCPQRVLNAQIERSDWDGEAIVDAELVTDVPAVLRYAKASDGTFYRGWPTTYDGDIEGIGGQELVNARYLLPRMQVLLRLKPGTLPAITDIPTGPLKPDTDRLLDMATDCLIELVRVLNREIGPLLEATA